MNKWVKVLICGSIHAVTTVAVFYWSFGAGMKGSAAEAISAQLFVVLAFPILLTAIRFAQNFSSLVVIASLFVNSGIWGFGIVHVADWIWGKKKSET